MSFYLCRQHDFLVRAVDTAREGLVDKLPGLTSCLAPLADGHFDPVKDGKPLAVGTLDKLLWNGADPDITC